MGYTIESSLIYGLPADEVPQQWYDDNACEDAGCCLSADCVG